MQVLEPSVSTARELRTSSYVIYVDLPDDRDTMLLVHGYTGAHDRVSSSVAGYLRSLERGKIPKPLFGEWAPEPEIPWTAPSDATVERLRKRGYLTDKTVEEEREFFEANVARIHMAALRAAPSYVIMPTYECNLRCPYCFQDEMRRNPALSHLLRFMTPSMADRIIASTVQIEEKHGVILGADIARPFMFFGGEPLLARARPVIEHFMKTARAAGKAIFSAVTNGTEIDSYLDLLGPEGIGFVQVTIDGPPEHHDSRRIYADGSGSFDVITRNVTLALERSAAISLRVNSDRTTLPVLPQLAAHFERQGWADNPRFSAYTATVHEHGPSVTPERRKELLNSSELGAAVEALREKHPEMRSFLGVDEAMKTRALQIFTKRASAIPSASSFCGANRGMYIFDAFGDIYACWERTGDKNIRIGYVGEDGVIVMNEAMNSTWRNRTVASNPVCRQCRFAMNCGGGCAVLAEATTGNLYSNFCDAFGKRFRTSVAQAYLQYVRTGGAVDDSRAEMLAMQEALR